VGTLIPRTLVVLVLLQLASMSCSPEARRARDGGPGADPGNKDLVVHEQPDPRAADTTLWPGRAEAPTDLLAGGRVPPPTFPVPESTRAKQNQTPLTPDAPPSTSQQRTFDRSRRADPQRQTDTP
jgi:hypothetical protein